MSPNRKRVSERAMAAATAEAAGRDGGTPLLSPAAVAARAGADDIRAPENLALSAERLWFLNSELAPRVASIRDLLRTSLTNLSVLRCLQHPLPAHRSYTQRQKSSRTTRSGIVKRDSTSPVPIKVCPHQPTPKQPAEPSHRSAHARAHAQQRQGVHRLCGL